MNQTSDKIPNSVADDFDTMERANVHNSMQDEKHDTSQQGERVADCRPDEATDGDRPDTQGYVECDSDGESNEGAVHGRATVLEHAESLLGNAHRDNSIHKKCDLVSRNGGSQSFVGVEQRHKDERSEEDLSVI